MLAPLATLAFLATLWLIAAVIIDMLGTSGGKIALAFRGRSPLATAPSIPPVAVRVSQRARPQRALRAPPRHRAAA